MTQQVKYHKMIRFTAGMLMVIYLTSFSFAAFFHPIGHLDSGLDSEAQHTEVDRCYHLHNALDFNDVCKHQAHFSVEHKHCEVCDVLSQKIEFNSQSEEGEIVSIHQIADNAYDDHFQKNAALGLQPLRGPPVV